ncbi:hypothetical protein, partial [Burkholderia thailandensis]|uniref:hypothetical protein n=1 Tax=Burkholderia thailandensis TaxID=57975 RepID=UPI001E56E1A8
PAQAVSATTAKPAAKAIRRNVEKVILCFLVGKCPDYAWGRSIATGSSGFNNAAPSGDASNAGAIASRRSVTAVGTIPASSS